ncbi:MAG: flagellar filament outer layer protein FlaA [Spirochaetia bacterium]|nr:flagellar filament outer layer protein FlaA [Spirochaetia bacterium]
MNKKVLLILLVYGFISSIIFAERNKFGQEVDIDALEVSSKTVESWETDEWEVKASPSLPIGKAEVKLVDGVPKNLSDDQNNKKSLGLKFSFAYQGYNSVTLTPKNTIRRYLGQLDEKNERAFVDIQGISLPGKVRAVGVYVLGRGNDYNMEAWVEDWRGDTHLLKFGSLNFIGWRPLIAKIPVSIPQDIESFPPNKNLVLKKFVIRSTPNSGKEDVYLFFDGLKVLSDSYQVQFGGDEINFDEEDRQNKEKAKDYGQSLKSEKPQKQNSAPKNQKK